MLRTDRIAVWIIIGTFALIVPSVQFLKYLDELVAVILLTLAVADSIVNGAWRRYRLLWILLGIMAFYAVYSMTVVRYNTRMAIIIDILVESKPFIALFVIMAIRPVFTGADKELLRIIAFINISVCAIVLMMPNSVIRAALQHISYGGIYITLSSIVLMISWTDSEGQLSRQKAIGIAALATLGLLCGRSKFYGEYVLLLFFLFAYRPGMLRRLTLRHIAVLISLVGLVVLVAWKKFSFYFITGNSGSFDPETLETFARPVLYLTGLMILADHFPFGTGLASFASFRSAEPYSGVYAEYGIDKVYGLSAAMPDFICDAFYPSLAQFGIVGVALFIWLWIYVVRLVGRLVRFDATRYKNFYAAAMLCVLFVLIESTSGTAMVNSGGMMAMLLLGTIAGRALDISSVRTPVIS